MGEIFAFIGEMIVRIVFEAILESIWYGLKRLWYFITGRERTDDKRLDTVARHEDAKRRRRIEANEIRRKHGLKEKRYPQ